MATGGGGGGGGPGSFMVNDGFVGARADGRLTLVSGGPLPPNEGWNEARHSQTMYYTPYKGNLITLFNGAAFRDYAFDEISIPNTGLGDGADPAVGCYDVFAYADAGGFVKIEFSDPWGSFTVRNNQIALLDGVPVKALDHTRRLIGTVALVSEGLHTPPFYFYDSLRARYVSNLYNAVPRASYGLEGYGDDDTPSVFDLTAAAAGGWQIPLRLSGAWPNFVYQGQPYLVGDAIYLNWVSCEPRWVQLKAQVYMKNLGATIFGAGLGVNPGDDKWDVGKMAVSARSEGGELMTAVQYERFTPIGLWASWLGFFAEGGSQVARVYVDDKRRTAEADTPVTYTAGVIVA